jgi:predicted ATPase
MLQRLHLRNFTVFEDAEFEFGKGLNVIVGANGTGKSHVLKAGYVTKTARFKANKAITLGGPAFADIHLVWTARLYSLLLQIFSTDKLENLIKRNTESAAEIAVSFDSSSETALSFQINLKDDSVEQSEDKVNMALKTASIWPNLKEERNAVFIPAKEVLTMGWLPSLYERFNIPIDQTYPDLLKLLFGPPLRQPEPAHIVAKLQALLGGKVEEEGGHFYLAAPNQPRMEMNLVAEGLRKFATLYKLLANGTLTPDTTLFWDEPEANLNPALLRELAAVLAQLAKAGFQIILATHSLFLLKELHILSQREKTAVTYFGLYAGENGATQVETQTDFVQLQHIAALDAELAQTFDFEEALDQADADDNGAR